MTGRALHPRRALGIGELLWDELPDGHRIGGAPFNATAHLARLGHQAAYATAVGRDALGDAALEVLRARDIDTAFVARVDELPTGVAAVTLDAAATPTFEILTPAAYEALRFDDEPLDRLVARRPDMVVIGTLAHRSGAVLDGTCRLLGRLPEAICLYDVNLRPGWWSPELVLELARRATILKLSEAEAEVLAPHLGGDADGAEAFSRRAAQRLGLRAVTITAGAEEASLLLDGTFVVSAPPPVDVADSVGAGDAFAAGLLDAIVRGLGPAQALRRANALGALVASQPGAVPPWTAAQLAVLEAHDPRPLTPDRLTA